MNDAVVQFSAYFEALTGFKPYQWHVAFFERIMSGVGPCQLPEQLSAPTGSGKTMVLAIALIAMVMVPERMPRRIIYMVSRRTVVDQTTALMESMRQRLDSHDPVLMKMKAILDALADPDHGHLIQRCGPEDQDTVSISTLRGEYADNRNWLYHPTRPSLICGTIDMIGSRLLFAGYRSSRWSAAWMTGIMTNDAWIILDEAHLEPAFHTCLQRIIAEQHREPHVFPLQMMAMTATGSQHGQVDPSRAFTVTADYQDASLLQRLNAKKSIHIQEMSTGLSTSAYQTCVLRIAALMASGVKKRRIIIFLRTVEDVVKTAIKINKLSLKYKKARIAVGMMTGTKRVFERERELRMQPMSWFLDESAWNNVEDHSIGIIIATSAGEIGVDFSADDAICDATSWPSMVQRFGRVNRGGWCGTSAQSCPTSIVILTPDSEHQTDIQQATIGVLASCHGDVGLSTLMTIVAPPEAHERMPDIMPWRSSLLNDLAMSSSSCRDVCIVPVLLHGISDREQPAIHLAWRDTVDWLDDQRCDDLGKNGRQAQLLLQACPILRHELATQTVESVRKLLDDVMSPRCPQAPVWIMEASGYDRAPEITTVKDLFYRLKESRFFGGTIIFGSRHGGLSEHGLFDGETVLNPPDDIETQYPCDISCLDEPLRRDRVIYPHDVGKPSTPRGFQRTLTFQIDDTLSCVWFSRRSDVDPQDQYIHLPLAQHLAETQAWMDVFLSSLMPRFQYMRDHAASDDRIPPLTTLVASLRYAAVLHDLGKRRELWQRRMGNTDKANPIAKPIGSSQERLRDINEQYRHELGTLVDLMRQDDVSNLVPGQAPDAQSIDYDLVLHCIAAHHGRARPHFSREISDVLDPVAAQTIMEQHPNRFARLQRVYGIFFLAYCEALIRSADAMASRQADYQAPQHMEMIACAP